jgi:hypothetical protein
MGWRENTDTKGEPDVADVDGKMKMIRRIRRGNRSRDVAQSHSRILLKSNSD